MLAAALLLAISNPVSVSPSARAQIVRGEAIVLVSRSERAGLQRSRVIRLTRERVPQKLRLAEFH